jgi:hypothetical protein
MSEVKVNKITPTTNCGTVTLGDSGDTIAIPAGVTLTSGGALTNSGTITNTGTITGVTITGTIDNQVNWQTDSIKTTGFTAVAGEGYFCNTTSAAFTVTLPATPSAGDLVGIKDYANTADTNNITIGRNGSNIEGVANDFLITVEGGSITLIYVDATQGWLSTAAAKASDISEQATFITATGGTETTCGDFKIHTFTRPGTFCVSALGNPAGGPNNVDYLVIAGGGGGGGAHDVNTHAGGGGGAGGYRTSYPSPLGTLPVSVQGYPITVGAGAPGQPGNGPGLPSPDGGNSIFSTITSAGGGSGGGGNENPAVPTENAAGGDGGSGGGGGRLGHPNNGGAGGSGNTPPVSPPQGNNGAAGAPNNPGPALGGGGGGAAAAGSGQTGGTASCNSITGSVVPYSGGGSGGDKGPGGTGCSGAANKGNAGDGGSTPNGAGGNGSSGVVIIRYKFQ